MTEAISRHITGPWGSALDRHQFDSVTAGNLVYVHDPVPPGHKLLTARDGSPILQRPDGRLWRVQPNGSLAPTTPVEMLRSTFAPTSSGNDDG